MPAKTFCSLNCRRCMISFTQTAAFCAVAHPFRHRDYITDPDTEPDLRYFDAIEAFNQENRPEDNDHALRFAAENGFPITAGGDVHNKVKFGLSGLAFNERLYTEENFIKHLKAGNYRLIENGIIIEK